MVYYTKKHVHTGTSYIGPIDIVMYEYIPVFFVQMTRIDSNLV